ncbi:hypothetical protein BP00DRAFT_76021 [Aspergillus indologenus CBS 114.80]|uniref:Uncharacterized protein n=1 Tax=Aspergillus indologenus CBS 114.80 TaxID=1450541 RepID=A0A2V5IDY7_9EURO|nr:hypothetical protein BP00DRAFT_76021 [Aspergillus indologenus CBS 114.80]
MIWLFTARARARASWSVVLRALLLQLLWTLGAYMLICTEGESGRQYYGLNIYTTEISQRAVCNLIYIRFLRVVLD